MEDAITTILDCERLGCHLENNLLVQANAVNQRLCSKFEDDVKAFVGWPETGPSWKPWKLTLVINSYILSGKDEQALEKAKELAGLLSRKQ